MMSSSALSPQRPVRLRASLDRLMAGTSGNLVRAVAGNKKALAGLTLLLIFMFMAIFPRLLAHEDPSAEIYPRSAAPSASHLFGTTAYGQDIFSQWVFGTRESLFIALVVGGLATVLSVVIGVSAAYRGGLTDGALSLFTDVFLVIPAFPLVLVIAAYSKNGGNTILIAVLVVTGWSYGARQLRSQALSLRNRDFLSAARVRGERQWRIIMFEILPTMTSLIVANFLGAALYAVLAAAGLQFIGLGNPDAMSWGTMLFWAENNEALQAGSPLWAIVPGISIALLGGAFSLLNYAFDEIGNPSLRPVRRVRG
jgi:peptide/nickel transport system permease protein